MTGGAAGRSRAAVGPEDAADGRRDRHDGEGLDFKKLLARWRCIARQAVCDFVEGAACGDPARMVGSFEMLDHGACDGGGWVRAMRAVTRLTSVPHSTQEVFLRAYIKYGDHIRQECNDLILADGLRVLLPKYEGPAMRLYRGEAFRNRSRRTYGLSWTANADVARQFAERGLYRTFNGGSVLLETFALPEAIICAPALLDDRYAEEEYIVDRRRLRSVKVVDRFTQLSGEGNKMRAAPPREEALPVSFIDLTERDAGIGFVIGLGGGEQQDAAKGLPDTEQG